jgi:hypothetical protein
VVKLWVWIEWNFLRHAKIKRFHEVQVLALLLVLVLGLGSDDPNFDELG